MIVWLVILGMALCGAPLFSVLAAVALWGFYSGGIDLSLVAVEAARIADTPVLASIPLFAFAGETLARTKASERLSTLASACLGALSGGLAAAVIVACAFFTVLTGASGVTIIALGALFYPALQRAGHSKRFSLGLVTISGSMGLLFPPSIPLILFGVVAKTNIVQMFLAGLVPGVLLLSAQTAHAMYRGRKIPRTKASLAGFGQALKGAAFEIPLPLFIILMIGFGVLAVSEIAAVAALYVVLTSWLVHREIDLKGVVEAAKQSMLMVGGVLAILAMSLAAANFLIDAEVPTKLFDLIHRHIDSKWTFLIVLNLFLLVLGTMLDIFSAVVLVVPILLPIARQYGVDPVHLGIIFLANMEIGYCTPPIGLNLFIASQRFREPVLKVCRACAPFLLVSLAVLVAITAIPALSLTLPRLVR